MGRMGKREVRPRHLLLHPIKGTKFDRYHTRLFLDRRIHSAYVSPPSSLVADDIT